MKNPGTQASIPCTSDAAGSCCAVYATRAKRTGKGQRRCVVLPIVLLLGLLLAPPIALSEPVVFTQRSAFDAALSSAGFVGTTLGFDTVPAGSRVASGSSFDSITFEYNLAGGVQIAITDAYATTSARNSLGTEDADMTFKDGDAFGLGFPLRHAVGMYFIFAPDPLLDGDAQVAAGGATASLVVADAEQILADGGIVYFLGVVDVAAPFTAASVTTAGHGAFVFNVDDIVTAAPRGNPIPLPGSIALLASGAAALRIRRRR